jgi:hypothetical protein
MPRQIIVTDLSGSVVRRRESVGVSLQVQIMLVLSGHPNGRATLAAMNADLKVLAGAGEEWSQRVKRLAANAPGLDIFTEGYVVRDGAGWQITAVGRTALQGMDSTPSVPIADKLVSPPIAKPAIVLVASGMPSAAKPLAQVVDIAEWRHLPRRAV